MAVEMHLKLILMALVLATGSQGGYLHAPSSQAHTHHGYSSHSPQSHNAASHAQYVPAQAHTTAYTSHGAASHSYVASQPAVLSQPAHASQSQYTPSHYSPPQYYPQSAYQYSSVAGTVAAPLRQTIVSYSQTKAQPMTFASQAPVAPTQVNYASNANTYVTHNIAAAPSISYAATQNGLTSQSASYPASTSYMTSQTSHSAYPASQVSHLNLPTTSHTYAVTHSAPKSQPSYAPAAVSAALPAQSAQYSSSQSYSSQNPQAGHTVTYTVPQNDYKYLRQYKQGDYHFQTGSAAPVSAPQQNNHHHDHGPNYQVAGQHQSVASVSPITSTVVQLNGDHHQVSSNSNSGGYHYQAGSSSAAPVIATTVVQQSGQHQTTSGNNGYSYQAASSVASAPAPTTIVQHSANQHQDTSGSNGYHYEAGSSQASPVSSTVVHHESGHHEIRGNSNSGGYQYQTGFQPITSTVVHHNGDHHEVSESNGYSQGDSSHAVTHHTGSINLGESYNTGYSQAYSAPAPVIFKHIYFHAPPADVDERPIHSVPVPAPKKTYNIVFIKVPSQEHSHGSNLQSLAVAPQAPIEDKTLIYVLVKKPDPPQILVQQPAPKENSQHEVFYVKYKGDVGDVANQINEKLFQQGSLQAAQLQQSSAGYQQGSLQAAQLQQSSAGYQQDSLSGAPLHSQQEPLHVVHEGPAHAGASQTNVQTVIEQQQLINVDAGLQPSLQPPHVSLQGLPNGHH